MYKQRAPTPCVFPSQSIMLTSRLGSRRHATEIFPGRKKEQTSKQLTGLDVEDTTKPIPMKLLNNGPFLTSTDEMCGRPLLSRADHPPMDSSQSSIGRAPCNNGSDQLLTEQESCTSQLVWSLLLFPVSSAPLVQAELSSLSRRAPLSTSFA